MSAIPYSRGAWGAAVGLSAVGLIGLGVGLMTCADTGSVVGAQTAWAAGPNSNFLLSATPMGDSSVVICVVDTAKERLAVYVADARRSRLKLLAVRDISADWALTDYNNDPPLPKDVRARIESLTEKRSGPSAPEETPVPAAAP